MDRFLDDPDPLVRCVLFFGPDRGLVRERADKLARTVVEDLSDPFRVTELSAAQLKDDPARLRDEAAAMALTGGDRVVRLRDAGDGVSALFKDLLTDTGNLNLVVAEGGELAARSTLRKVFEGAKNAAVIGCYSDEGRELEHVIRESLKSNGLAASSDALAYLVGSLGGDRLVVRGEMEKLALYVAGGEKTSGSVELEDAVACVGDSGQLSLDSVVYAVGNGDQAALDHALDRAFLEGVSPVALLRAGQRHFHRLHLAVSKAKRGGSVDQAVSSLRPPIIFKFKDQFVRQARNWSEPRLNEALELLSQGELDCKSSGIPAEPVCNRVLMRVAQAGKAGHRG